MQSVLKRVFQKSPDGLLFQVDFSGRLSIFAIIMQLTEGQMCLCKKKKKKRPVRLHKITLESGRIRGSNKDGRDVFFSHFLKMVKDSAARIEFGRSFHQMGTVNEKVCESDFVPLWDGAVMRRSLAERKLLEGI